MSAGNGTINPNRTSHNQLRQSGLCSTSVGFGAIRPFNCSSSASTESRRSSTSSRRRGADSSGSLLVPSPLMRSGSANVDGSKRVVSAARKVPKNEMGMKKMNPTLWTKLMMEVMNKARYQITTSSHVMTLSASSGFSRIAGLRI